MVQQWNFRQELVFCFGHHLADNPTQHMLEKAFRHHGMNWRYVNFELGNQRLAEAVRAVRVLGFRGGNCTMPCKVSVIPHLDRLGQSAGLMEAVNCVVVDGEELVGENTDGKGFLQSLREVTDPAAKRVTILGAGGAARAIAVETALAGASRITIVNRSPQRGRQLVELLQSRTEVEARFLPWEGDHAVAEETEILINATSIGMHPDAGARSPPPHRHPDPGNGGGRRHSPTPLKPACCRRPPPAAAPFWTAWACWSTRASSASASGAARTPTAR